MKIPKATNITKMINNSLSDCELRNEKKFFQLRIRLGMPKKKIFRRAIYENEARTNLLSSECLD